MTHKTSTVLTNDIENILDRFDFDAVKKTMEVLGWKWRDDKHPVYSLPTYNELRRTAKKLLMAVVEHDDAKTSSCTGGFEAYKDGDLLMLSFVIADANNKDDLDE